MGKLSDADWQEMSARLRARAAGLIKQLDAGKGYRDHIEKDLLRRLGDGATRLKPRVPADPREAGDQVEREALAERESERTCASCSTANDADARFCKSCGTKL